MVKGKGFKSTTGAKSAAEMVSTPEKEGAPEALNHVEQMLQGKGFTEVNSTFKDAANLSRMLRTLHPQHARPQSQRSLLIQGSCTGLLLTNSMKSSAMLRRQATSDCG
jgi:hypothetical protein